MAAQGQDPSPMIKNIADVITRTRNGESIENAALAVFTPPAPTPQEQAMAQAQAGTVPPGSQAPVEQAPLSPATPGSASGGTPQQGAPDLMSILAGLQR